jgi:adenosylhomocysteine nucleosidase
VGAGALRQSGVESENLTRLGVVAALPFEARCLSDRTIQRDECVALGEFGWLVLSGMGAENATRAAGALVKAGARRLLSWGTAAALDPALAPGTVVLPTAVLARNGPPLLADAALHAELVSRLREHVIVNTGNLAEATRVLTTVSSKSTLFRSTGAVAADMESAAIAAVAQLAGLPFIAARAILDRADETVPKPVIDLVDDIGHIRGIQLTGLLLRRPGELVSLCRLARRRRAARLALRLAGASLRRVAVGPAFV